MIKKRTKGQPRKFDGESVVIAKRVPKKHKAKISKKFDEIIKPYKIK